MVARCTLAALCFLAFLLLPFQPGSAQEKPKDEGQKKEDLRIKTVQEELKKLHDIEQEVNALQPELVKQRFMYEKQMQALQKIDRELQDAILKRGARTTATRCSCPNRPSRKNHGCSRCPLTHIGTKRR